MFLFEEIDRSDTVSFIKNLHYAGRMPSVSYAFGVKKNGELIGVVTYGKPASNSLCVGVCGEEYSKNVYELNRLVLSDDIKNLASMLVSYSLKELKRKNLIIVSYADVGMGHVGYVYQATNFIYTGKTKERTDKYTEKGKHSRHYTNEFNNLRVLRTSKHRYIYFAGDKRFVKEMKKKLNYNILPYPKGDNMRYELGYKQKRIVIDKNTGEKYEE